MLSLESHIHLQGSGTHGISCRVDHGTQRQGFDEVQSRWYALLAQQSKDLMLA